MVDARIITEPIFTLYKQEKNYIIQRNSGQILKIDKELLKFQVDQDIQDINQIKSNKNVIESVNINRQIDSLLKQDSSDPLIYNQILLKQLRHNFPNAIDYQEHFAFNQTMLKNLEQDQFCPFRIPVIYGNVYIKPGRVYSDKFANFYLISRKDCRRLGRRFMSRGIDKDGNTSNFVETERIIALYDDELQSQIRLISYVQTRGSIPLFWTSKPTMKWSPPLKINMNIDENKPQAVKHLLELKQEHHQQVLVNLINKQRSQQKIGQQFTKLVENINDQDIEYVWFDFHHECRGMKYQNLASLVEIIKEKINGFEYFDVSLTSGLSDLNNINDKTVQIYNKQIGCIRTNCMDCLDRTNVVQSVFDRYILFKQLFKLNLVHTSQHSVLESFEPILEELFRDAWTQNADVLSILYTGTPALKTDFTRTGKRTLKGALNDGKNGIHRYYINQFCDGYNQDCLDFAVDKLEPRQMIQRSLFLTPLKITLLTFGIGMIFLKRFMDYQYPIEESDQSYKTVMIQGNGKRFVDKPSLDA
eukprot:403341994